MKKYLSTATVAFLLGWAVASPAATATVLIGSGGLVYTPATTNIAAGDQVIWTWSGLNHSTTSDTALWDSGLANSPHAFTNQFNAAGSFPYHCTLHGGFGMTGAIIVTAPNSPPSVTITNPVAGTVYAAPANVTLQAAAADPDGSVTNVQFRLGSTILTNKTSAPFFAATNNLPAGSYTLTAIASDNLGAKATNSVSLSVVTPTALVLSAPLRITTNFQFNYAVNTGLTYLVQRSTNLAGSNWISIFTNKATSNPVSFVERPATNSSGFYRVGRLPNP